MSTYIPLAIYNMSGEFVGYAIKATDVNKLQSTNLWVTGEEQRLNERIAELNSDQNLKAHWPHPQDPAVKQLLDDPNFHPIEYVDHEVVDEDHSYIVYVIEPEVDVTGQPTGKMLDTNEINREASVLKYKTIKAPARPTDQMTRIKAACEAVARQRML